MFKEILLGIIVVILTQVILTPILYGLHPTYSLFLNSVPFGTVVIFILDNFGFVIFMALVVYIFRALYAQQQQNTPIYGGG